MATEVLINDGGAPARIIPYIAGSTISAGDPLQVGTDGGSRCLFHDKW